MITIDEKSKCCGCTACYSVCTKECISMRSDSEGFLYPEIDRNKCVECGACEKICPFNNLKGEPSSRTIYTAVQNRVESERLTSTAGGAFSLFADYIIKIGGVVYAVGYDENMVVCHKPCTDKERLAQFRGSKYVQSTLSDTFREIKALLKKQTKVLFVGTPCQVHGLKNYVSDNENLYTIDFLCLGVSSPALFAEWISYLNKKYGADVSNVQFRNKHYGYATPNVRVFFDNGREMDQKYDSRVHANLFFRYYNVRPSCYECEFREVPRASDFTMGDFSEIGKIFKDMDDDKGTTKLWIHTQKGRELLEQVKNQAKLYVIDEQSPNVIGGKKIQITKPKNREQFFSDACQMDYFSLVSKWEPRTMKGEIAGILRPAINKLPFKSVIFKKLRSFKTKRFNKNVASINKTDVNQ